mmetsp:Transcript_20611/g.49206  ORF Transcript_20611/g.49206 Transcript_20611/m.49206 type:complete len:270 (-) Transcript_20611:215-1024(-)
MHTPMKAVSRAVRGVVEGVDTPLVELLLRAPPEHLACLGQHAADPALGRGNGGAIVRGDQDPEPRDCAQPAPPRSLPPLPIGAGARRFLILLGARAVESGLGLRVVDHLVQLPHQRVERHLESDGAERVRGVGGEFVESFCTQLSHTAHQRVRHVPEQRPKGSNLGEVCHLFVAGHVHHGGGVHLAHLLCGLRPHPRALGVELLDEGGEAVLEQLRHQKTELLVVLAHGHNLSAGGVLEAEGHLGPDSHVSELTQHGLPEAELSLAVRQ